MSISGVIVGVSPDWRGSSLRVVPATTDAVLQVADAVDFADEGGWLLVADEATPRQYVARDTDADTVTLAAALGTVYDVDTPVVMWDPTVEPAGAPVREDVAQVMLPDAELPVDAVLKHEQVPTAGIFSLVGATAVIEEEDPDDEAPDWVVTTILGREAVVDSDSILTPYARLYRSSDLSVADSTLTTVPFGSFISKVAVGDVASGWVTIEQSGIYLVIGSPAWQANSNGARYSQIQTRDLDGVVGTHQQVAIAAGVNATITPQVSSVLYLSAGWAVSLRVQQNSGASLSLLGSADGRLTSLELVKVATL